MFGWLSVLRGPVVGLRLKADRSRDAREWQTAAALYGAYLDKRPADGPIWVQRGNCLKEAGDYDGAMRAYWRAEELRPTDADLQLQLGHLSKVRGDLRGAIERYRRAVELDPADEEAGREVDQAPEFDTVEPAFHYDWSDTGRGDDWLEPGNEPPAAGDGSSGERAPTATRRSIEACIAEVAADQDDREAWDALERRLTDGLAAGVTDAAMRHAIAAAPAEASLQFELGRLLLRHGYALSARDALRRAFRREPRLKIAHEFRRLGAPRAYLDRIARREVREAQVFLDVSDLLHVLSVRATVTGIQRVQCNLMAEVLAAEPDAAPPSFTLWADEQLWRLQPDILSALLDQIDARGAGDLDGRRYFIQRARETALRIEPQAGDALIATGVAYLSPEFPLCGQALKKAGVKLGAVIHDFIPLTHPELANATITQEFATAISDILIQLDFALPNSEFTAAEARRLMAEGGYDAIPMRVVPLAHSLRTQRAPEPRTAWTGPLANLKGERFALCVGTFVAHKNQELLVDVWRRMLERGIEPPTLVLVGHKAHGVDELFQQLETTRWMDGRIRLLEGLDDGQIEALYQGCLFTLFPSKVEGWGLPVGESLAHGKVCVASNAASIPEVGGPFAIYIDPYNVSGATDVIAGLLADPEHLAFLERRLRSHFKARTWAEYARDLTAAIAEIAPPSGDANRQDGVLLLEPGQVLKACIPSYAWEHGAALPPRAAQAATLMRKLMLVEGWGPPETWGVWMDGPKARLRFRVRAQPGSKIVVALQLRAAAWAKDNQIVIRSECGASTRAPLPPAWSLEPERSVPRNTVALIDCVVGAAGEVELAIELLGQPARSWWGEPRTLVLGLVRLMFLPADPALIGLEPGRMARPGLPAAGPAPRLTAMSSRMLTLWMRNRVALTDGWRLDDAGRAWMTGRRSSLTFYAEARPGSPLRILLSAVRPVADQELAVEISVGSAASSTFDLAAGQERANLWLDCQAPPDGRIVVDLQIIGRRGADLADGAGQAMGIDGVLFGPRATADDRQRLMEAVLLPAPSAPDGLREAQRRSIRFIVAGHMKGSYSLAQMNRRLALALEGMSPGSARIEQVESRRLLDLADAPPGERAALLKLAARPAPDEGPVVSISQHWPIWSRPVESDLSLAFFHWEEGLLPRTLVGQLNDDFDGVLAPTRSVAKALVDSGVMRPVLVVGDGPDVAALLEAGADRLPAARPADDRLFTFLHVSSCFPRKGVDALLEAYAAAFDAGDPVRLVIKGFPNPHNDVDQQIARLRATHPAAPRIEFINEDLAREDVDALIHECDCMVLPSRGEGFNLPALEALAAGVPVIATGFGGHVDFLNERVARLVDYRFAASQSHVSSPGSTWVEPDRIDLAEALREAFDHPPTIDRAAAGRQIAGSIGDDAAWARRIREAALDLLRAPAPITPKVAWVSTWQVRCGIAQYSSMLLAPYPDVATNVVVLCDGRTPAAELRAPDRAPARVAWDVWDSGSMDRLAGEIDLSGADVVVIQHQPGLIRWADLASLLRRPQLARREVIVELHTIDELPPIDTGEGMDVAAALREASRVLVHTVRDLNALKDYGLIDNVALFPHGVTGSSAPRPPARRLPPTAAPVIGSYGFFLPRKGIDQLIRAFAIVRRRWPKARLRLVNAEFPDVVSRDEIERCRALARRLGVFGAIEWRSDFLENEESHRLLRECDLVVLAYQETKESASGAVRVALASGAPVAVTPLPIFEDIRPAAVEFDGADEGAVAAGIAALLADREARSKAQARAAEWAGHYAWPLLAQRLAGMVAGLVATSRVPGGAERMHQVDAAGPAARADGDDDDPAPTGSRRGTASEANIADRALRA